MVVALGRLGVSDPVKGVPDTNISSVQAYIKTELRRAGKKSGTLGKLSEILKRHKVFTEEDAKSVSRTMIDTAKLGITASKDYLEREFNWIRRSDKRNRRSIKVK